MTYVIILSYHAPDDLRRCIDSVLATRYPTDRWSLLVVDNDSREDTREVLAAYGARIDVVANDENLGYAEGMNVGIRRAISRDADAVVLLNQDTTVEPDWLGHLVQAMESDPRIGAVQPRIMLPPKEHGAELVNSVGNQIHVLGFAYAGGHREPWSTIRQRMVGFPYPEVTYCSGAAVLYRVAALRDVSVQSGEFLERDFFMYHEDVDLGVRLTMRGWRNVLAPQAVVTHYYEFSRSVQKLYWMERNRLLFLYENFRWRTLLLIAPMVFLVEIGLLVFALRGGWIRQKLRAWRDCCAPRHWHFLLGQRRAKQAKRFVDDRHIVWRFTTLLTNQETPNVLVSRVMDPVVTMWWRVVRRLIVW